MSDAAEAAPAPPAEPPVTAKSDPNAFLFDGDKLADFIDKLRASGVKTFEHPSGLRLSFEPSAKLPVRPAEGW